MRRFGMTGPTPSCLCFILFWGYSGVCKGNLISLVQWFHLCDGETCSTDWIKGFRSGYDLYALIIRYLSSGVNFCCQAQSLKRKFNPFTSKKMREDVKPQFSISSWSCTCVRSSNCFEIVSLGMKFHLQYLILCLTKQFMTEQTRLESIFIIVCTKFNPIHKICANYKFQFLVFHDTHSWQICQIWQIFKWISTPCYCVY